MADYARSFTSRLSEDVTSDERSTEEPTKEREANHIRDHDSLLNSNTQHPDNEESNRKNTNLGFKAGRNEQGHYATAIGYLAGSYDQGLAATAIGFYAGYNSQSSFGIALGYGAGYQRQGHASIAIGHRAGVYDQHPNTIIISAVGGNFNSVQSGSFYVKPIRGVNHASIPSSARELKYDPVSGEIMYIVPPPPSAEPETATPSTEPNDLV